MPELTPVLTPMPIAAGSTTLVPDSSVVVVVVLTMVVPPVFDVDEIVLRLLFKLLLTLLAGIISGRIPGLLLFVTVVTVLELEDCEFVFMFVFMFEFIDGIDGTMSVSPTELPILFTVCARFPPPTMPEIMYYHFKNRATLQDYN